MSAGQSRLSQSGAYMLCVWLMGLSTTPKHVRGDNSHLEDIISSTMIIVKQTFRSATAYLNKQNYKVCQMWKKCVWQDIKLMKHGSKAPKIVSFCYIFNCFGQIWSWYEPFWESVITVHLFSVSLCSYVVPWCSVLLFSMFYLSLFVLSELSVILLCCLMVSAASDY